MFRKKLLSCVFLCAFSPGCRTFQPVSQQGHDLLDNPGRSALIRLPAGLGAILGHVVALPISVILYPTWFFEGATVESCDVLTPCRDSPSKDSHGQGDLYIPLVQASQEYASGLGAVVLAQPFEWIAGIFRDPPGPPPGQIRETPERKPGEKDPALCFDVHPPAKKS